MKHTSINIKDLLNTDYLEYAKYVVHNRAIPYMADGFKPTQRKIIYTALKRAKANINVSAFAGYIKAESAYHHADSSLDGQIINLAQDFKCAMPYFVAEGQFGSVYSPEHSASRYLEIRLSKAFELLFLDNDLINRQWEEGKEKEPETYLPILPTILLNSIDGIGLGFSYSSTNRNPLDVANAALKFLQGKKLDETKPLPPCIHGLSGKWIWHQGNQKWEHHGIIEVVNTTTVKILGIPYGWTYDSYEDHLSSLVESGWMQDWVDLSNQGVICYELKFRRADLAHHIEKDELYHKLKMYTRLEKDNYTIITTDGKPHRYDTDFEVLKEFVSWRKTVYTIRKDKKVASLKKQRSLAEEIIRFIELVISGTIRLDKIKSKDLLIEELNDKNFKHSAELTQIRVYKLTEKEREKLKAEIEELDTEINYYTTTSETDLYINDVKNLIDQLKKEGYKKQEFEVW